VTARERFAAIAGGVAAGAAGGLFGVGGGIVLVPILVGYFRLTQHQAHGTSLAVIGATALASVVVYGAHHQVAWLTALVAGISSVFTARLGARTAVRTSTRNLKLAFAVMLVVLAVRLLWKMPAGAPRLADVGLVARLGVDVAVGAGSGFLAGLLGIGGGVIAVPAFRLLLGMPQQLAQGTSLALILLAAPVGAIEHARFGNVVGRLVGWIAVGAIAGGLVTSQLVQAAPGPLLTRAFAVFLLANALWMGFRALSPASPKAEARS